MHTEVKDYCLSIKAKHPQYFKDKNVLDVWSLDINGNNRYLFEWWMYTWVDLWEWPNVDIIWDFSKYPIDMNFDIVISTEMLEHCENYTGALKNMVSALKSWWLLLITAAGEWRPEHWTTQSDPSSAPFTNNHYKNIVSEDFDWIINEFIEYEISKINNDIRFYWIKNKFDIR